MCDVGYDESDVWVFEWTRARKEHPCCACAEPIKPGAIYHSYKSLSEGEWTRFIHCARCWSICEALWAVSPDAIDLELNCGEVWNEPPEDVAALAFVIPADLKEKTEHEWATSRKMVMP